MNGEDPDSPGMREMLGMARQENGVAESMMTPVYERVPGEGPSVSQAEVVADLFNVMRLDVKALAEAAGADLEIQRMSPEKAAVLIQDLVMRNSLELVEKFNELEDMRETALAELVDDETLVDHQLTKQRVVYSQPDPGPDARAELLAERGVEQGDTDDDEADADDEGDGEDDDE